MSWDGGLGYTLEEADVEKRPWRLGGWASRNEPQSCGVVKEVQGWRKALGGGGGGDGS